MSQESAPALLTTKEAARVLNLSPDRIRQLARAGELKFVESPYGRLFPLEEVERLRIERERMLDEADARRADRRSGAVRGR